MYSIVYLVGLIFLAARCLAQSSKSRVLIYSATREFRHDSIPVATQSLKSGGSAINVEFDSTEDQGRFTDQDLAAYDALLFLMNTGEVLDATGKAALQRYLNVGGNFIAVHSASDCLNSTAFYGREVGAYFDYHADLQMATVNVLEPSHPSANNLPLRWQIRDEWYNFKSDPRTDGAVVVLSVDESTYTDTGTRRFIQGTPHPTAWYQEHGAGVDPGSPAGRSFYTSLGHLSESWRDSTFLSHVLGGISWALQSNTTKAMNASATVGNPAASPGSTAPVSTAPSSSNIIITPTVSASSNAASANAASIPRAILSMTSTYGSTAWLVIIGGFTTVFFVTVGAYPRDRSF